MILLTRLRVHSKCSNDGESTFAKIKFNVRNRNVKSRLIRQIIEAEKGTRVVDIKR